jgi:hypothetical protein
MWSLRRLVRGLSALFWGLPLTLLASVGVARMGWFGNVGVLPVVVVNALLLFGLWQMSAFQPQERIWRAALDRSGLLGLVNCGLSPYLVWWRRAPGNEFFEMMVLLATCCGLIFLITINLVLHRLSAMLPDETLRSETRSFTILNRLLLVLMLCLVVGYGALGWWPNLLDQLGVVVVLIQELGRVIFVVLLLLPLAMTMALIWKTKEVILESVFSPKE